MYMSFNTKDHQYCLEINFDMKKYCFSDRGCRRTFGFKSYEMEKEEILSMERQLKYDGFKEVSIDEANVLR